MEAGECKTEVAMEIAEKHQIWTRKWKKDQNIGEQLKKMAKTKTTITDKLCVQTEKLTKELNAAATGNIPTTLVKKREVACV